MTILGAYEKDVVSCHTIGRQGCRSSFGSVRREDVAQVIGQSGGGGGSKHTGGRVLGWGGREGGCRERRRECFTAVSLDFCSTHQNSAACRQELGGRALTRFVLSVGPLPLNISVFLARLQQDLWLYFPAVCAVDFFNFLGGTVGLSFALSLSG